MRRSALAAVAVLALSACSTSGEVAVDSIGTDSAVADSVTANVQSAPAVAESAGGDSAQAVGDARPSEKDVIALLLANADVPLSVDPSCAGVGASMSDRTIGDFLSGFLSEYRDERARNWLRVSSELDGASGSRSWKHTVMLHQRSGGDVWGWGVSFLARRSDGAVDRQSFRCLGAG